MSPSVTKIAIFISGSGSNARVMIDRFQAHPEDNIEVALVVSSKHSAGGLTVAAERGVPSLVLRRDWFKGQESGGAAGTAKQELLTILEAYDIERIVLAGFLWLLPDYLVNAFPRRILNIHPALLPAYGGKGMYGANVHRAVHAAGEPESGITIHYVNEHYDKGDIIYQAAIRLDPDDSPEQIAERVLRLEHANYWRVVRQLIAAERTD